MPTVHFPVRRLHFDQIALLDVASIAPSQRPILNETFKRLPRSACLARHGYEGASWVSLRECGLRDYSQPALVETQRPRATVAGYRSRSLVLRFNPLYEHEPQKKRVILQDL